MKNSFQILYNNQEVTIEQLPTDQHGNVYYVAHLPAEDMMLEYTEDDEGAGHWLDKKTNHQTPESTTLGQLIELHMVQHKVNA